MKGEAVADLIEWVEHRVRYLEIETENRLAELAGLEADTVADFLAIGTLDVMQWSERRSLAAALRVPLKKLYRLESGEVDWIGDDELYDAGAGYKPAPGATTTPVDEAWWREAGVLEAPKPATPVVGTIRSDGTVNIDEAWSDEFGKKIPVKFAPGQTFALDQSGSGQSVVFRMAQTYELRVGEHAAVWVCKADDFEGFGYYGRVQTTGDGRIRMRFGDATVLEFESADIRRVAKIIGRWPIAEAA